VRLDGILTHPPQTPVTASQEARHEQPVEVIPEVEWRRREQANLRTALKLAKGRVYGPDGAAEILGVKPTTLISRLKAVGLRDTSQSRDDSRRRG
jgi:transcriptional regulator with GAF, ATPase, and Fis domain